MSKPEGGDMQKKGSGSGAEDLKWWFQWQAWDLKIMWPAWYVTQQLFSGGEQDFADSRVQMYGNEDTAWWYLWAFFFYPIELVFDAAIFVVLSPVYLVDGLIRLFGGEGL